MAFLSCRGLRGYPNLEALEKSGFASEEIVIVVADLCPHHGNERWCPQWPGQTNHYGSHNHLDFSHPLLGSYLGIWFLDAKNT